MRCCRSYLLAAGGAGALLLLALIATREIKVQVPRLRIAMPSSAPVTTYDPAQIRLDYEYIVLEALYSSLTEHDPRDQLVSGVSDRFTWDDETTARFHIRPGLRTIDGLSINAEDVVFSLKRVLITGKNTHGSLAPLLCGSDLTSIDSPCDAIRVEGDSVLVKLAKTNHFLFEILSSIDFAIIPRRTCDPDTLRIVDYRNTSGPYYLDQDLGSGRIRLKANPYHFRFRSDMPQEIEFVPNVSGPNYRDPQLLYRDGIVDHVPTVGNTTAENLEAFFGRDDLAIHRTLNLKTSFLTFTRHGRSRSRDERLRLSATIQRAIHQAVSPDDRLTTPTRSLFPPESDFAPTSEEMSSIERRLEIAARNPHTGEGITIVGTSGRIRALEHILRPILPLVRFVEAPIEDFVARSGPKSWEDTADLKSFVTDVAIAEEINGISYGLKRGRYALADDEIEPWLERYLNVSDKRDRIRMMRNLHVHSLIEDPVLIPLHSMPYVATIKKPWHFEFSRSIANNQFHWLRYSP